MSTRVQNPSLHSSPSNIISVTFGSDSNLPARLVTGMKLLGVCQFHQVGGGSGRFGRSRHLPDGGGAISLVLRMEFLAIHQLGLSGSQHCNRVRQYDANSPHMGCRASSPGLHLAFVNLHIGMCYNGLPKEVVFV